MKHTQVSKSSESLKKSLAPRIITALILLILVLFALFTLPQMSFGIISALVFLLVISEWPRLMGKQDYFQSLVFMCSYILFLLFFLFLTQMTGWLTIIIMFLGLAMWIGCFFIVNFYETHQTLLIKRNFYIGLLGFLILSYAWLGLNVIRDLDHGVYFVLYFFILIWGIDTVAFFIGKKYGKRKLTPNVSPNKTIEGAMAGFSFALIMSVIAAMVFPLHALQRLGLIPLTLVVTFFSMVGDLLISVFKRAQKIKDTGVLLPGHGGLLDRMDSLLAGAPVFALGLLLLGLH